MTTLQTLRRHLAEAWERFYLWKSEHQYLGRYSVEKLAAFEHYQRNASWLRVAAVILLTPLPTYLVLLIMDGVPMRDPRDGAKANGVAFARSVFSHIVMTFGVLMAVKEAVLRTHQGYSLQILLVISVWVVVGLEFACIGTAFLWRFPVPFREVIFVPLWLILVVGLNWYFAKEALLSRAQAMIRYIPLITTQFVFFYALLGLAMAYAIFSMTAHIILTVSFPLRSPQQLYQTVSLQFAKTPVLSVVIMVSDLVQAMIEVREYLGLEYLVDSTSTLSTAVKILQGDQARILEQTLQLLFSCEVLLVSEYFEVIIPVLYAFSLLTEWFLPNAKFNMIVMGMSHAQTISTFTSSISTPFSSASRSY
ncbi:hypothetical protein Poli38472_007943 [Pythium oligandrum]|uniref:Uncharacterized protein n=1 Tax=Pythium oligandrum TaxID=41045 RepID=A0A8K1CKI6_PYTOL|nr:hypothetical protein Poli38472_007943 [Pythium oligandrum]|eukprot:TMW65301.1 hypothetical protein Poli38472_007943 [Pythium oligandrum]